MSQYEKELAFAKRLALQAGKTMKRYFRTDELGLEIKDDQTPLTIADTSINSMVISEVKQHFPKHGVIGEEESYEPERGMVWVVDPIDGTMPFSLGLPLSTFLLALVDKNDGQPVVGVVYDPHLDKLYSAFKGGGAYLNDATVSTSDTIELNHTFCGIGGGGRSFHDELYDYAKLVNTLRSHHVRPMTVYSGAYLSIHVASGEFVAGIHGYGSPWDYAAQAIIVREAGGVVTDVFGHERRFDEWSDGCLIAANASIHKQLVKLIQEAKV